VSEPAGLIRADREGGGESPASTGDPALGIPDEVLSAALGAEEKLGTNTVVLAMGELLGVVDAFVITSGRNARQVRTLVDEIERRVKMDSGRSPRSVEGLRDGTWVLMDYGDFIVHVFLEETRSYYDLEHLWAGAPRLAWQAEATG
jgi:ribosome-associated protein